MIRKAYNNYFEDHDKSVIYNDELFLLDDELIDVETELHNVKKVGDLYVTDNIQEESIVYIVIPKQTVISFYLFSPNASLTMFEKNLKNADNDEWRYYYIENKDNEERVLSIKTGLFLSLSNIIAISLTSDKIEVFKEYSKIFFRKLNKRPHGMNGNIGNANIQGMFNQISLKGSSKSNIVIDSYNFIDIDSYVKVDKYRHKTFFENNLYMGSDNFITTNKSIGVNLIAGNNNYIYSDELFKELKTPAVFLANNKLINPVFYTHKKVLLKQKHNPFAIRTMVTNSPKEGDNYIRVKNTTNIMVGHKIKIATYSSAFITKEVVSVIDGKVFFDSVLTKKEDVIEGGIVFSDTPKELDSFNLHIAKQQKAYRRRFYVKHIPDVNLFLRTVEYNNKEYKVTFVDKNRKLVILNDIVNHNVKVNDVFVGRAYKFINKEKFVVGQELPVVYVGEKILVGNEEITVKGFDKRNNKIYFEEKEFSDVKGLEAITSEIKIDSSTIEDKQEIEIIVSNFLPYVELPNKYKDLNTIGGSLLIDGKEFSVVKQIGNHVILDGYADSNQFVVSDTLVNGNKLCKRTNIDYVKQMYKQTKDIIRNKDED